MRRYGTKMRSLTPTRPRRASKTRRSISGGRRFTERITVVLLCDDGMELDDDKKGSGLILTSTLRASRDQSRRSAMNEHGRLALGRLCSTLQKSRLFSDQRLVGQKDTHTPLSVGSYCLVCREAMTVKVACSLVEDESNAFSTPDLGRAETSGHCSIRSLDTRLTRECNKSFNSSTRTSADLSETRHEQHWESEGHVSLRPILQLRLQAIYSRSCRS